MTGGSHNSSEAGRSQLHPRENQFPDTPVTLRIDDMIVRNRTNLTVAHGLRREYKCLVCGAKMRLKRRQSHPTRGAAYELQTYACRGCGNTLQVSEPTPDAV